MSTTSSSSSPSSMMTLSSSLSPAPSSTPSNPVSQATMTVTATPSPTVEAQTSLSAGAKVGITVGAVVGAGAILLGGLYLFLRRRKQMGIDGQTLPATSNDQDKSAATQIQHSDYRPNYSEIYEIGPNGKPSYYAQDIQLVENRAR
jgi:hypothetical protein